MQTLKSDIRERILEAGQKEFYKNGFMKTSMRDIASRVGIGVGNLYNYFPSKDELFRTVLNPVLNSFKYMLVHHQIHKITVEEMFHEESIRRSVKGYTDLLKGNRNLMKILLFQSQGSSLENFKQTFTDKITEAVQGWLDQNSKEKEGLEVEVSNFMIRLHTACMFTMLEEILMLQAKNKDIRKHVEEYIRIELFGWRQCLRGSAL